MRKKYDWEQLEHEFIHGQIEDASEFIRRKLGANVARSGTFSVHTVGWHIKRDKYREGIRTIAAQKEKNERIERESKNIKIAEEIEFLATKVAYAMLNESLILDKEKKIKGTSLLAKDVKILIDIARLEQGKNTSQQGLQGEVTIGKLLEELGKTPDVL